ncbi:DUF305 domain-containing protein [Streptomyces sp. 4N509B]|uniref:DUF305 domain-containing protein n=1 Tax=Streptomyces sp. 4N509B TaxID=3457413 RepID=UPI003FD5612B
MTDDGTTRDGTTTPARSRGWWLAAGASLAVVSLLLLVLSVAAGDDEAGAGPAPPPTSDSADAGFARDMAIHHQQGVDMSFVIREGTENEDVRRLAYDIINTQANQRGMLLALLETWDLPIAGEEPLMAWMAESTGDGDEESGGAHGSHGDHGEFADFEPHDGALMPGMATDTQLAELREAEGTEAEILFLQLMTAHHEAGVEMARAAAEMGTDEELVSLADSMVSSQESEITLMTEMLADRDAEPLP